MAAKTASRGYRLLREAEQKFLAQQGEGGDGATHQEWTGVLFRVGEAQVLAPMTMLQEIVPAPSWIHVPGVRGWLLGLANIHGTLVPVVDLEAFLFGRQGSGNKASQRLLVINDGANRIGVLVPEVMGMKHFWTSDEVNERPRLDERLQPYISAALRRYGEHYPVFDMRKLFNDPAFQQVAV